MVREKANGHVQKGGGEQGWGERGHESGGLEYPAFGGGVWCYSEEASRRMSLSAL